MAGRPCRLFQAVFLAVAVWFRDPKAINGAILAIYAFVPEVVKSQLSIVGFVTDISMMRPQVKEVAEVLEAELKFRSNPTHNLESDQGLRQIWIT